MILTRRSLITGFASFLAAPAIVRASSLMSVKTWDEFALLNDMLANGRRVWGFAAQPVQLAPSSLNYATPYPGWRFRFENGIMFHEPDTAPSAA